MSTLTKYHQHVNSDGTVEKDWLPHREELNPAIVYRELCEILIDRFVRHRKYIKRIKYTSYADDLTIEVYMDDHIKYVFELKGF